MAEAAAALLMSRGSVAEGTKHHQNVEEKAHTIQQNFGATTDLQSRPLEDLAFQQGALSQQVQHHQQAHAALEQQQQQAALAQQIPSTLLFSGNLLTALQQQQQEENQLAHPIVRASHNLIPSHLQANNGAVLATLNGTPGYPPALIPHLLQQQRQQQAACNPFLGALPGFYLAQTHTPPQTYTVQDRPMEQPVYNGVNPAYPGLHVVNTQPPIFCVDNFLTEFECDFLIHHAQDSFGPAPVVGKGAGEVSPSRTSSTCYLAREDLPDILRKVSCLTGKPVEHCELPQVGRYWPSQQYLQHYDAFDMSTEDGRRFAANGGQRTITVLIYLNTVVRGGATRFPSLNLDVQPVRGMALIFFPATVDGLLDKMALHAAMPAIDTKFVSQVWIRQSAYLGQPSKRLPQTLGVPFGQEHHNRQHQQADLLNLGQQQQQQAIVVQHHHHHQQANLLNLGDFQQQQQEQQTVSPMTQF